MVISTDTAVSVPLNLLASHSASSSLRIKNHLHYDLLTLFEDRRSWLIKKTQKKYENIRDLLGLELKLIPWEGFFPFLFPDIRV